MRFLFLLLLSLALSACAEKSSIDGTPTKKYDNVLNQFNSDLEELGFSKIDFSQTVILEADLDYSIVGQCHSRAKRKSGLVFISLSKDISPKRIEMTIYHEIGHCFFGLNHDNGYSLMHSSLPGSRIQQDFLNSKQQRLELLRIMAASARLN